jgi:hypothetical protein
MEELSENSLKIRSVLIAKYLREKAARKKQ